MVDMPRIHFGNETNGYEFSAFDRNSGQVMASDGNGQLNRGDVSAIIQAETDKLLKIIDKLREQNIDWMVKLL